MLWALELMRFYKDLGEKYNQILRLEARLGLDEFGIKSEILRRGSFEKDEYRFNLHSRIMPVVPLVIPFIATLILVSYAIASPK